MAENMVQTAVDLSGQTALNVFAGTDDVLRGTGKLIERYVAAAGEGAATNGAAAAADAAATQGAERAALSGLSSVAKGASAAGVALMAMDGFNFVYDVTGGEASKDAKMRQEGGNVVADAISATTDGVDMAADAAGTVYSAVTDTQAKALSMFPVVGPVLGAVYGAKNEAVKTVGATAANLVKGTLTTVRDTVNNIGDMMGIKKAEGHADEIGRDTVLESDSLSEAAEKGGLPGIWSKLVGGGATDEEAAEQNIAEAQEQVGRWVEAGAMTEQEAAAFTSTYRGYGLVGAVNEVISGDKSLSEAVSESRQLAYVPESYGTDGSAMQLG